MRALPKILTTPPLVPANCSEQYSRASTVALPAAGSFSGEREVFVVGIVGRVRRKPLLNSPDGIRAAQVLVQVLQVLVYRVKNTGPSRKKYWSIAEGILVHRVKNTGLSRKLFSNKVAFCRTIAVPPTDLYVLMFLFLMYVVGKIK